MNESSGGRRTALSFFALIVVVAFIGAILYRPITDEWVKNILLIVFGRFLGYVDNIYSFEFNTTRASTDKNETIAVQARTAAVQAEAIAAAPQASPFRAEETTILADIPENPPKGKS